MVRRSIAIVVTGVVLVAAWGGSLAGRPAAQTPAATCASAFWLDPATATPASDAPAIAEGEPAPAWMTIGLTDACSGEPFTLADFSGKTLYVESMATWCGECYEQLTRLKEAAARIPEANRADIVLVALSSEVGLTREALAEYATTADFPFVFAVMSAEMLAAMVDDLGRAVAIPPAMPFVIVAPDGTIGDLRTGGASADEILAHFVGAGAIATP